MINILKLKTATQRSKLDAVTNLSKLGFEGIIIIMKVTKIKEEMLINAVIIDKTIGIP